MTWFYRFLGCDWVSPGRTGLCFFYRVFTEFFPTSRCTDASGESVARLANPTPSTATGQRCEMATLFCLFFCCFFLFLFSFLFFLIFRWDLSPILLFLFAVVAFVVACCLEKKNILFQKQKKKQNKSAWLTGPKLIGGSGNRNTRQRQVRCFFLFCFLFDRDERSSKTPAVKCSCSYF